MDSRMAYDHPRYGSIPVQISSFALDSSSSWDRQNHRTGSSWSSRPGKRVLVFASIVIVSAFLFGIVALTDNLDRNRVSRFLPSLLHTARTSSLLEENGLRNVLNRVSYPDFVAFLRTKDRYSYNAARKRPNSSMGYYNNVARTGGSCPQAVDDFYVDEMVEARDCSTRRQCRARVIASKEGSHVQIKAGYYIFTNDGKVRTIDEDTKRRVASVTLKKAHKWADILLDRMSHQLATVNCTVTSDMVAEAIMEMKQIAASCPMTDDPLCNALVTVITCTVSTGIERTGGTPVETECLNFVRDSPTVTSLVDLQNGCSETTFMFNRVGVSLPFCTTTCPSNPCAEHTVYAEFHVQTNVRGAVPEDCLSAALIPAYETFYGTIPNCDNTPTAEVSEGMLLASLFSINLEPVPQNLLEITNSYACELTYAYFVKLSTPSFSALIDSSCASA